MKRLADERDALDALLDEWDLARPLDAAGAETLRRRIVARAETLGEANEEASEEGRSDAAPIATRGTTVAASGGEASSASWGRGVLAGVVAASLLWCAVFVAREERRADREPRVAPGLTDRQLDERRRLFGELNALFENRVDGFVESARRVEFGLDESDRPADAESARPLAVRVVVEATAAGTDRWTPVWTADLVVRNERTLRPARDASSGVVDLWAFRLPDGSIQVDGRFLIEASGGVDLATSALVAPRRPTIVRRVRAAGRELRVWHWAADLTADDAPRSPATSEAERAAGPGESA